MQPSSILHPNSFIPTLHSDIYADTLSSAGAEQHVDIPASVYHPCNLSVAIVRRSPFRLTDLPTRAPAKLPLLPALLQQHYMTSIYNIYIDL